MRFGIEIEFKGSRAGVARAMQAAGLVCRTTDSCSGHSARGWLVKQDGSVSGGGELVSPPLEWTSSEGPEQLQKACEALTAAGVRFDEQTGIHVHVESAGMQHAQLVGLVRTFSRFEDSLFRIAASVTDGRTIRSGATSYCQAMDDRQIRRMVESRSMQALQVAYYGLRTTDYGARSYYSSLADHLHQLTRDHYNGARYYALNLHSHWYRGTVEFRLWNGTCDPAAVSMFVGVSHALVVDAMSGRKRSVNRRHKVGDMHSGQLDPAKAVFQLLGMLRYQAGLSLADYRAVKRFFRLGTGQRVTAVRY